MTRRSLLMSILALLPAAALGQDAKASDDDWTTKSLRNDITVRLKNAKGRRSDVAKEIGAEYATASPSEAFVKSAINLFSSTDPLIRAVALASLNAPGKETARAAIPFIHAALNDPRADNRRIALDVIATVDGGSEATITDFLQRAYLDSDSDIRQAALQKLDGLMASLQKSSTLPSSDALSNALHLIHNLQQTMVDETDTQSLAKLSSPVP